MPLPSRGSRLAAVAKIVAGEMPDLGTLRRTTSAKTAGGGDSSSSSVVASEVPVRIRPYDSQPDEGVQGDRASTALRWLVAARLPLEVRVHDVWEIAGRSFEVVGVLDETFDVE